MRRLALTQGRRIRKIYINFASYSQNIYLLSSHRSHKSHEMASRFALAVGYAECTRRMAAASFLRCSLCEIREICVRLNHLRENILARQPYFTA